MKLRLILALLTFACGPAALSPAQTTQSAAELCASRCPAYLACADGLEAPAAARTPLFCGGDPADAREARCEQLCADDLARLGDSEADFVACASCVGAIAGEQICDDEATNRLGAVACRDSCSSLSITNASDAFYNAFAADVQAGDAESCTTGSIAFAASDPRVTHASGAAASDGAWACGDGACGGYLFSEGPAVTLPPGTYDIRLDGVAVETIFTSAVLRFMILADDATIYDQQVSADALAAGPPTATITLGTLSSVTPRLKLYSATSARLASVTFVRR